MRLSGQCFCLVLFVAVSAVTSRKVTDDEKAKINKGINAGMNMAVTLQFAKQFGAVLDTLTNTIGPWVEGIGIFTEVLGFFMPEDTALLNEMKRGFNQVYMRLDSMKDELTEIKKLIKWEHVQVNFQGIEQDIRLLDRKLNEVVQAPDPDDGKDEYVRVYENQYNEAGLLLWDSIVYDDQIFSKNVVRAGMEYTEYHRAKMERFMRGLIILMLKSANVEVAYEKFRGHNRGTDKIWKGRLSKTKDALAKADKVLENAWSSLFQGEVDKMASECRNCGHKDFCDKVYYFLSVKYPWRYWGVLAYDELWGFRDHTVAHDRTLCHLKFRYWHRSYLVCTTDPNSASFDSVRALSEIKDRTCPGSLRDCKNNAAKYVIDLSPYIGVAKAAFKGTAGYAYKASHSRVTGRYMHLRRRSWKSYNFMVYMG